MSHEGVFLSVSPDEVVWLALLLALPLHDEAAMLHVLETLEGERLRVVLLESAY